MTDETVYDNESNSHVIYDHSKGASNAAQSDSRHDFGVNKSGKDDTAKRTLLGHKAGNAGIYIMVSTDSEISLKAAANLMAYLGCDYAVNMDSAGSVQMQIKSGYGADGKVTSGTGVLVHTAVCAYTIN